MTTFAGVKVKKEKSLTCITSSLYLRKQLLKSRPFSIHSFKQKVTAKQNHKIDLITDRARGFQTVNTKVFVACHCMSMACNYPLAHNWMSARCPTSHVAYNNTNCARVLIWQQLPNIDLSCFTK